MPALGSVSFQNPSPTCSEWPVILPWGADRPWTGLDYYHATMRRALGQVLPTAAGHAAMQRRESEKLLSPRQSAAS